MSDQIAMLNGLGGRKSRKRRKGRSRRRSYAPQYVAGLGVGEEAGGIGGMTIVLLGAVAIGAFIIIKKMGDNAGAPSASSYKKARDAYVASKSTYTKSLYE